MKVAVLRENNEKIIKNHRKSNHSVEITTFISHHKYASRTIIDDRQIYKYAIKQLQYKNAIKNVIFDFFDFLVVPLIVYTF